MRWQAQRRDLKQRENEAMKLPPAFRDGLKVIAVFGAVALVIWAMPGQATALSNQTTLDVSVDRPILAR